MTSLIRLLHVFFAFWFVSVMAARLKFSLLEMAVPVILVLLIDVPDWRQLAGSFFYEESLFHWDFFSIDASSSVVVAFVG